MEQQIVMRLLFVDQPIPNVIVESWMTTQAQKEAVQSLEALQSLHLIQDMSHTKTVVLTNSFKVGLKDAVVSGKLSCLEEFDVEQKYKKTVQDLYSYGVERWECVLKYMALPSAETEKAVSAESRQALQAAGFVKIESQRDSTLEITSKGFQFLLMDRTSQLWIYLLNYLKYLEEKDANVVEPLTFLFHLSFCTIGKAYSSKRLTDQMEDFLQHLREAGLVYQRKRKAGWFYATPLAISLTIGRDDDSSSLTSIGRKHHGFISVETNFRLYAYTDSVLQLAVVSTFTDMTYRFANMTVGVVTRESVRKALQVGITSVQIIEYLKANAHEMMLKQTPIIPQVICDQLRLWELERDRFQFDEGVLYSNFLSDDDFTSFRNYAKDLNVLLWENAGNRLLVVNSSGHDLMKQYWKKQKQPT
jgi:transcription initiation factor TFIIH subunit 4